MSEQAKRGTIWQDDDLDVIVSNYFSMLSFELLGEPYIKSRHTAAVMARLERSHRSVEFKNQNISAVLCELGMPWIPGYKPKSNYQNAIFDAIDRYLSDHPTVLEPPAKEPDALAISSEIFVSPPLMQPQIGKIPMRLQQLVRKFDPVERDHRNRNLGQAGEAFVLDIEKRRLTDKGCSHLARKVRWTSMEDGDGAGYDVSSFHLSGKPLLIEVKTTNGAARTPFFLTRNEFETSKEHADAWSIYRVHLFATSPRIFTLAPPLEPLVRLTTETWRASF